MTQSSKKATIEERIKIIAYCLEHNRDYKETAADFYLTTVLFSYGINLTTFCI
ncbi:MAG: hypothetical protein HFG56_11220 [Lachnospiraceae bacterium]|nr:hypothetical protein [Lachnospiraceae bacterium]MCI9283828.1 hypothetical protein [Lachnospiraceae bacterium]